jgi:hypothetical protein
MMFSSSTCRLVLLVSAAFNAMTSVEATAAVDLGFADDFVILAKTGISTVPDSVITGDIAVSPIFAPAMTAFAKVMDSSNEFSTSAQVTGNIYAPDYAVPTPAKLTTAVSAMETAYTDAAGRPNPDAARQNLGEGFLGGNYGGPTNPLTTGVYTFTTGVTLTDEVVFDAEGDATAVFIIQMAGSLSQNANLKVTLAGGALAKNIFWQVATDVTVGAGAHMEGIILAKTAVTFITGSSLNGRVLTQTRCNLQVATITQPTSVRRFLRSS